MGIEALGPGDKAPEEFYVVIEIPAYGPPVKYEVDKDTGLLMVDRFMNVAMSYPANYGFIPGTLGGDGDPVDVLVMPDGALLVSDDHAGAIYRISYAP